MSRVFFLLSLFTLLFQGNGFSDVDAAQRSMTILAMGDSTTAGTPGFLSGAEAPPEGEGDIESQYAFWMMKKHPEWRVINRGINGQRSDEMLERFEAELDAFRPERVILLAGVNDLYQGKSPESVKANLTRMCEISKQRNIKIVLCTILPYNLATPTIQERIKDVNQWIRGYSQKQGFIFCDTFQVLDDPSNPFHLQDTPDQLHPSVDGYRKMGEAIASAIERG